MRKILFAVLTFASMGYVASAQTQTPTPDTAAAATAQPVEEPKICLDVDAGGNSRETIRWRSGRCGMGSPLSR